MKYIKKMVFWSLFLLLLLFTSELSSQGDASIVFSVGEARVTRNGKTMNAEKGLQLQSGDRVSTGPQSLIIIEDSSDHNLKLLENTTLTFSSVNDKTTVELQGGGVFSKVNKLGKKKGFSVETPTMVAAVRGTEFFVAYASKNDDLWVCVNEGEVAVSTTSDKKSVNLKEGEGVMISGGTEIKDPMRYKWTRGLNWNMDPGKGAVEDNTNLDDAYDEVEHHDW